MRPRPKGKGSGNYKHGGYKSPLYYIWVGMRKVTRYKTNPLYYNYGGRGIKVCERWEWFPHFEEDMLPTWKKGLRLGRLDRDKDFSPENCVWRTWTEEANNRRNNLLGNGRSVKEECAKTGLKPGAFYRRVDKGWTVEEAITIPPGITRKKWRSLKGKNFKTTEDK